jgi:CheY-like chemotaxis protein
MPDQINILLIEDDHDDIDFLTEALKDNNVSFNLKTLMKGDLINKYITEENLLPDLIIMDLNLPKLHGREVICRIKDSIKLKEIPLVVLTTSSLSEDREYCLRKGADKFISKPATPEGFNNLVDVLVSVAGKRKAST